jgi:PAS domain S-box-containing protein
MHANPLNALQLIEEPKRQQRFEAVLAHLREAPKPVSRVAPDKALQTLLAATTADLGHDFFRTLVRQLTEAFRVTCALVGEMQHEKNVVRTLAFWSQGDFQPDVTYPLHGTPCFNAVNCSLCYYSDEVATLFPEDLMLTDMGLRGYLGAALKNSRGESIGVLAVLHDQPLEAGELDFKLLYAFAARAGAELERIQAQAELERTRDFLRNTLNAVPDPLFVKDRAHRWVGVNAAFCKLVGRNEKELLGRTHADLLPPPEAEIIRQREEEAFTSGQPVEHEEPFYGGADTARTLIVKRAVFPGADGQPSMVAVLRDLTERKRLEMQLRQADRMASVGQLAAGVAHEINNPLAYVCSNLSFLTEQFAQNQLSPEEMPELREVVAETQDGVNRVRAIVKDLKTFARPDEERLTSVDMHAVIDGALRLLRNEMQYRIRLERALEPVPHVRCNEGRLSQVLVNLLVNAVQAFPALSPERNLIRVATRSVDSKWVALDVVDNGSGMSPEVLGRIFEPFFTTKPVGVGTGLGLAICHSLITSMGGRIEVKSVLGEGTTFTLLLPVFKERSERPSRPVPAVRPVRQRLLLIDDELSVGTAVQRLLASQYEVHPVQDAREALKRLKEGASYDAILCDLMMPGMNGLEFLLELERTLPAMLKHVGMMSGGTLSAQAREVLTSRSRELMEKPFDPDRLHAFVEQLLHA